MDPNLFYLFFILLEKVRAQKQLINRRLRVICQNVMHFASINCWAALEGRNRSFCFKIWMEQTPDFLEKRKIVYNARD
jgi:hypothetical protein